MDARGSRNTVLGRQYEGLEQAEALARNRRQDEADLEAVPIDSSRILLL